jgi:hypothetical protein
MVAVGRRFWVCKLLCELRTIILHISTGARVQPAHFTPSFPSEAAEMFTTP